MRKRALCSPLCCRPANSVVSAWLRTPLYKIAVMDGAAADALALAALLARPAASPAGMETREAAAPEDDAEQLQRQRGHCSSPGDLSRLVPTPPVSSAADLFGQDDDAACGSTLPSLRNSPAIMPAIARLRSGRDAVFWRILPRATVKDLGDPQRWLRRCAAQSKDAGSISGGRFSDGGGKRKRPCARHFGAR